MTSDQNENTFDTWVNTQSKGEILSIGGWITRHETIDYISKKNNQTKSEDYLRERITMSARHIERYIKASESEISRALWSIYNDLAKNNIFKLYSNYQNLEAFPGSPWLVLNEFDDYLNYCCDFVTKQKKAISKGIEPIFIVSFPKTASSFIATVIAQGLDIPACTVTLWNQKHQLRRIIVPAWLRCFLMGGVVTHEHLSPFKENVKQLSKYKPKMIIHIREPKQVVISHVHHIKKFVVQNKTVTEAQEWYLESEISDCIDRIIKNLLPFYMNWVLQWYQVYREKICEIEFTSYEQFIEDKEMFFEKVAEIFCIPNNKINKLKKTQRKLNQQKGLHNMRNKSADEWKEVMSKQQQQNVDALIPKEFKEIHDKTLCY